MTPTAWIVIALLYGLGTVEAWLIDPPYLRRHPFRAIGIAIWPVIIAIALIWVLRDEIERRRETRT